MRPAGALRTLVLLVLASALFLPSLWRGERIDARAAWIESDADLDRLADSLASGESPPLVARASAKAPMAAELEALAAAAGRAPLFVALPKDVAFVEADAPAHALAGRAAAVPFRLRAAPNDSVLVRLSDATGVLDSVAVTTDAAGIASAAFRVRPPRAGWREWTVEAAGARATTGAWVDSAGAPRVLVKTGFPGWESKFVVRALEESGAPVETLLQLGRGMAVAQGAAGGTLSPERLARFDAVIVLDAAPVSDAERRALADYAARGGGVLLAGDQAGAPALGVVRDDGAPLAVDGTRIRWSLPPELAPLPADRLRSAAAPFDAAVSGSMLGAVASEGGVLALRPLGRGRAAALALTETWRWRMEAGRIAEHREFWRAVADWLASAPRDSLTVDLPEATGPVGARREVRVFDARGGGRPVPPLLVTRPDGRADTLRLSRDAEAPGVLRASFVPAAPGVYAFVLAGAAPSAGFRAVPAANASAADAWARLSLLAARSGGRAVPADSLRPLVGRLTADLPGGGPRGPSAGLVFAILLAAAGAEWAIRRLSGRA